jgi:hypothetical protein
MVEIDARRTNHPYTVTAVEDAPDPLPHLIRQNLPAGEGVEAVFVIPPEVYARGYRAHLNPLKALVFTHTRVLHVSESEQAGTWIAAEDILKVKMSMVLLYGLLEIWAFHGGEPSKIQVEYNTVSQRFLSPLIKAVLRQTWNKNPPQPAPAVEDPTFPQLLDMSYSFYNGLTCEALQPGEVVTRYVYQPELHASRLKVGQRKVYPQTLLCADRPANHPLAARPEI